jgi:Flp pilus assembly protein TadG
MKRSSRALRRGALSPLFAILLIPILGMVAFSVDMCYIVWSKTELQAAADSAALAGAGQLMSGYTQYNLPGQSSTNQATILSSAETSAKTWAKKFAGYNTAGGVSNLVLLDSDIEFGNTDSGNNYTTSPNYSGYPNTVKVTMRRDSTANTPLDLFFAPIFNAGSINVTATAAATIYTANYNSFIDNKGKWPYWILPMTYDVNHWNNYMKTGQDPDGNTTLGSNGYPEIKVYPSIKFTGNFGELSMDQATDGASTISGWITNGETWSDLKNEFDAGLLPLSSHDQTKWDWSGNPGLKTSTIQTLEGEIGKTYLLPLYKPKDPGVPDPTTYAAGVGQGSNYYYNIVQFVGINIAYVDNNSVIVQPNKYVDPSVLLSGSSITPAVTPTTANPLVTTFTTPKLTQ